MTEKRPFGTIKNYLKHWEHGSEESLLLELCEKVYEMQVDFDELRDNKLDRLDERIRQLEHSIVHLNNRILDVLHKEK